MKTVLYISYDGMTDPLGQSQVLPYLNGLSKLGHKITLLSFEKKDKYDLYSETIKDLCNKSNIVWTPLMYHKSPPIFGTLYDIWVMRKKAVELYQKNKFDLIHCRSYIPSLIGLYLKKEYGTKFVFDMRGLWADEKVDAGAWSLSSPIYSRIYRFFKEKEKQFLLNADHTVSLTYAGKKEILSWDYMKGHRDNVSVIPCCVDTDLFDYKNIDVTILNQYRKELNIEENRPVLSYLGSIGTWYMLDEMLDFYVEWKKSHENARFLFITKDEHEKIRAEADKRGVLEDIIIRPAQRNDVPYVLSLSIASVFFIRPTYSKISSSPTKQGELMAMGIPIVFNSGVGDTDSIVEKYHSGEIVSDFTEQEYKNSIQKLNSTNFEKSKLYSDAVDYFSLDKGIKEYNRIYNS